MDIIGCIDVLDGRRVAGWASDRDAPAASLFLQLFVDRNMALVVPCNMPRNDVAGTIEGPGKVGFDVVVPERFQNGGGHVIEFYARDGSVVSLINPRTGRTQTQWPLGPAAAVTPSDSRYIIGSIDDVQGGKIRGWAYDPAESQSGLGLDLYVDGEHVADIVCDIQRDDLVAAKHAVSQSGYEHPIPDRFFDDQPHTLEVRSRDGRPLKFATSGEQPGSVRTFTFPSATYTGQLDGAHNGAIRGWVYRYDHISGLRTGGLQVLVMMQHQPVAQITARHFRPDVADAHQADPNCGFVFTPPSQMVAGRTIEFQFKIIPGGIELAGSPCKVNFPSLETVAAIRDLQEATDKIFTELWTLRDRLRKMTPEETFTVENYDPWARRYYAAQAKAPDQLAGFAPADLPIVSVICPAYRPRMADFEAAVGSVKGQSYPNWELVIVDDASGSPELTARMKAFAREDNRIKPVFLKKNGGISNATNAAIAKARGHYIAFFDHDDMLMPRALEFMLGAALRTGARMLYCDEDKIDDFGVYSEVNLKPDWNYRLLLSQNYICHLLFVAREEIARVGPLRRECDGAQDHDLIIRLSEIIPHDKIHHVPEVLYHWRKTPTSTAASGKSKAYAVAAGAKAVQDHLDRKGLVGRVFSPREITMYDIEWTLTRTPAITVLIPYREHVGMTRECMEALLSRTDYPAFDVILIDNWSTSDEALAFAAEMAELDRVSVLRVEEPFNYSRLNNLAAAQSQSELLLFMNNDVVVHDPAWLRVMVGEMLADDRVGIVGNKLLYPNGTVQHAGVILGVGGIADHAHRGIGADDPGYAARAICAQDLSAVTAACLLCRRTAFEEVGGFDEKDLKVAFNDVDLCLKIGRLNRVVWTSQSIAEHRESLSRGSDLLPTQQTRFYDENSIMAKRWDYVIERDPHYNRTFSAQSGIFEKLNHPGAIFKAD